MSSGNYPLKSRFSKNKLVRQSPKHILNRLVSRGFSSSLPGWGFYNCFKPDNLHPFYPALVLLMFFVPRSWSRAVHLPSHPPKLRSLHSEVDASLASNALEYPTRLDNLGMLLVVSSHLAATRNEKDTPGKISPCYTTFLPEKRDSCNMMKSYWNKNYQRHLETLELCLMSRLRFLEFDLFCRQLCFQGRQMSLIGCLLGKASGCKFSVLLQEGPVEPPVHRNLLAKANSK